MALIKCPECGNNVSDKAETCIHCGYPLSKIDNNNQEENVFCKVYGKKYDLSKVLHIIQTTGKDGKLIKDIIPDISNSDMCYLSRMIHETNSIPKEYTREIYEKYKKQRLVEENKEKLRKKGIDPDAPETCPRCGSTQFSTMQRGHSLLFGWLGSGDPQNVCQKCGYTWTPGKRW